MVVVAPDILSFQPDIEEFGKKITAKTKAVENAVPNLLFNDWATASLTSSCPELFIYPCSRPGSVSFNISDNAVIINTPNNPTGVVYSEDTIKKIAEVLYNKQEEYGTQIYIISDEPYRELVYDGVKVPYITKYYKNKCTFWLYTLKPI